MIVMNKEDKEYLKVLLNDVDRLGVKGNYSVEDLFSCQDLRFIKYNYLKLQQENKQLKDNWNKLKEIAKSQSDLKLKCKHGSLWFEVDELLNKMKELEDKYEIKSNTFR